MRARRRRVFLGSCGNHRGWTCRCYYPQRRRQLAVGAGLGGLAPLTPCMVACLPRGVGVRLSSLYVPQVAVVVHAEVHLGDTGCPNDLVGRFSCVGSV